MQWPMVKILSTCCFLLLATSCTTQRAAVPLRPDIENPERMICEAAPERFTLPESYEIDWQAVLAPGDAEQTLRNAQAAHNAYVAVAFKRNNRVSAYIRAVEDRLFVCSNNAQWWRDYWPKMPVPAGD